MSSTITKRKTGRRTKGRRSGKSAPNAIGTYANDAWSLAKRTAAGLNEIRKFINIEEKVIDTSFSATVSYNASITSVTQVAQGLDINNRVGDSMRLQHLELRWTTNGDTGAFTTAVRVLMIRDLDGYGTIPANTDMFQFTGSVNSVNSPINRLNLNRFSVLYDETVTLSNAGPAQCVGSFLSSHQGHVRYLGTAANAASDGKGTIYIVCMSDRVTTLLPTVNWGMRVTFTDD